MRRLLVIAVATFTAALTAQASETFCAVPEKTRDGFVSLRIGPGTEFAVTEAVNPDDFLYVGTEQCRSDFGPEMCSSNGTWLFVEKVLPFHGSARGKKGWVNAKLIRSIACPAD